MIMGNIIHWGIDLRAHCQGSSRNELPDWLLGFNLELWLTKKYSVNLWALILMHLTVRDSHVWFSQSPLCEILNWMFSDLPFASLPRSLPKFGQDIHSLWNLRIKSTHCVLYLCVCVLLHQCQNSFTASLSRSFILCDLSDLMLGLL